ncbi:MAG: hypothetical protein KAS95_00395 [Candidatus Heimdallarchaeota archaeon]|nr:hypothetical protein [Candidatus Heimdallarchaeota archaeon]
MRRLTTSNRNRYDIYAEVLMVLRFYDEAGISQIGRRANIPLDRARSVVQFMISRGLIVKFENQEKRPKYLYKSTTRGDKYLESYKDLSILVVETTEEELDLLDRELME